MLQFIDFYLQTRVPFSLRALHELEHRIFLIPDLANIFDERHSKTNGMSYSRGIRFSLVTNNIDSIVRFQDFFCHIEKYTLPQWTEVEKSRFEAEESEWKIRQRQYFGSFATSIFERAFDKKNAIIDATFSNNSLWWLFSGVRMCQNFSLQDVRVFHQNSWEFPVISENFSWNENGSMQAIILPIFLSEYQYFIFCAEWIKVILRRKLQEKWKIYDLDFFNVYECEYILWVIHWYEPGWFSANLSTILMQIPTEDEFNFLRDVLLFSIDEQVTFCDQEANVIMGFSPEQERAWIQGASYRVFLSVYVQLLSRLSYICKKG